MTNETTSPVEEIVKAIHNKKGFNILVLDVHDVSTLTSYFVIAEGRVERHLKAISDEILDRLSKVKRKPIHLEGVSDDWIVVDYGDVIIHLFKPDVREKYALEKMWHEGKIVDIAIEDTPDGHEDNGFF